MNNDPWGRNGSGTAPPSPFTAAGRAHGKSQEQLSKQGLDGFGHPAQKSTNGQVNGGGKTSRPGGRRGQNLNDLINTIGSAELANQDDLHAFCEAYRALLNFLAVTAKLAEGQLKAAARANARQAKGRMLNPVQAGKLKNTLRLISRDLDQMANSCANGAASSVKAWRRFETLLDELENSGDGAPRPGRGRSGFSVV